MVEQKLRTTRAVGSPPVWTQRPQRLHEVLASGDNGNLKVEDDSASQRVYETAPTPYTELKQFVRWYDGNVEVKARVYNNGRHYRLLKAGLSDSKNLVVQATYIEDI